MERHIHIEVRKLYPDAELPAFEYSRPMEGTLIMTYQSHRAMADFAEGLILGCIEHFGEPIALEREDMSGGAGTCVRFVLQSTAVGISDPQRSSHAAIG